MVEQGEKVIVFSAFDEPVQRIAKHFSDAAGVLTGKTPSRSRQKLVDRIQKDPNVRVFVANIVAGGVGINLTAARLVVFNDLDWVPANHFQAEDRAYRIGQAATPSRLQHSASGPPAQDVRRCCQRVGAASHGHSFREAALQENLWRGGSRARKLGPTHEAAERTDYPDEAGRPGTVRNSRDDAEPTAPGQQPESA